MNTFKTARKKEKVSVRKYYEQELRNAYLSLNDEAEFRGWDSYEQAPEKEKKSITKVVAKNYSEVSKSFPKVSRF
jgi:hypothetical protein